VSAKSAASIHIESPRVRATSHEQPDALVVESSPLAGSSVASTASIGCASGALASTFASAPPSLATGTPAKASKSESDPLNESRSTLPVSGANVPVPVLCQN
jgi:hypothetical protein